MVKSRFNPMFLRGISTGGWRTSRIGAFPANFGGDIEPLRIMLKLRVRLLM